MIRDIADFVNSVSVPAYATHSLFSPGASALETEWLPGVTILQGLLGWNDPILPPDIAAPPPAPKSSALSQSEATPHAHSSRAPVMARRSSTNSESAFAGATRAVAAIGRAPTIADQ